MPISQRSAAPIGGFTRPPFASPPVQAWGARARARGEPDPAGKIKIRLYLRSTKKSLSGAAVALVESLLRSQGSVCLSSHIPIPTFPPPSSSSPAIFCAASPFFHRADVLNYLRAQRVGGVPIYLSIQTFVIFYFIPLYSTLFRQTVSLCCACACAWRGCNAFRESDRLAQLRTLLNNADDARGAIELLSISQSDGKTED